MMRWLTQFIEENKFEWERRREREHLEMNKDYERFMDIDEEEMIAIVQEYEEKENKENESKVEKASRRRGYWKEWRNGKNKEDSKYEEDEEKEKDEEPGLERNRQMTLEMMWKEEKAKVIDIERPKVPLLDPDEPNPKPENHHELKAPQLEPEVLFKQDHCEFEFEEEMMAGLVGVEEGSGLCMECVHVPCLCVLRELEERLDKIKNKRLLQESEPGQVTKDNHLEKQVRKECEEDRDIHEEDQQGQELG